MIVIYEGMDKVGKTTLIRKVDNITKFNHFNMDRGPAGFLAYDAIFSRSSHNRMKSYDETLNGLSKMNCLIVYLYAEENDINKRLKEHNEKLPEGTNVKDTLRIYESFVDECYKDFNLIKLNTSKLTIDECSRIIESHIRIGE